jgi:hypothetical protein
VVFDTDSGRACLRGRWAGTTPLEEATVGSALAGNWLPRRCTRPQDYSEDLEARRHGPPTGFDIHHTGGTARGGLLPASGAAAGAVPAARV